MRKLHTFILQPLLQNASLSPIWVAAVVSLLLKTVSQKASTFGFSGLDGVPMGTRPGHLDEVILYMVEQGWTLAQMNQCLYKNRDYWAYLSLIQRCT